MRKIPNANNDNFEVKIGKTIQWFLTTIAEHESRHMSVNCATEKRVTHRPSEVDRDKPEEKLDTKLSLVRTRLLSYHDVPQQDEVEREN